MENHLYMNGGPINSNVYFDKERLYFNKWEMYKLLAPFNLPFRIPYTDFLSVHALDPFISKQIPFFLKPVDTWSGKNISFVTPKNNSYMLTMPNGHTDFFPTRDIVMQRIMHQYANTHTIIQQQAPLLSYDNRAFDIRVHLQRDEHGHWLHAGDLVRIGGENAIVSNLFVKGGGIAETEVVLTQLFSSQHAHIIKENLTTSTFAIANLLDHYYPFIDIGADFGIDRDGNLWLLEVNTNDRFGRPGYDLFKKLPNKSIYKQMVKKDKQRKKFWSKNKVI